MKCKWCGTKVVPDEDADYGVIGVDGTLCCDDLVEGCPACEDGEAHPHEAAA